MRLSGHSLGIALFLALCLGPKALAQTSITLRFPGDSLRLRPAPAFAPGGRFGQRVPPAAVAAAWRAAAERAVRDSREGRRLRALLSPLRDTAAVAAAPEPGPPLAEPAVPPPAATPARPPTALEALGRYADVGLEFRSRLELKFDRLKNERCTAFDASTLSPGCRTGFPTPAVAQQFFVRAGGIVSQRVHVNVDYDSEREFSANNNISVYYQGLEDEILRRVDIGNVTFQVPASRFITSAVPANSFGIQAQGQLGPLDFRGIIAQQRGSALRSRVFTIGGGQATQPVDREARDLDFEPGRFFFAVNPVTLPGYPAVDILNIPSEQLPPDARIAQVRVYRLRAQSGQSGTNPNLGGIDAVAVRRDGPQRVGPFSWERLLEGKDYYLDPTGLWFALMARVGLDDFLAVSYVTTAGDTVGTFPAINRGGGDTLELIYEPRRGPEVATFPYEMRHVYRIGGGEVTRSSVALAVVLNESERPLDGVGTYLSRLGVARANDASSIDEFNRVFPRERDPNAGAPVRDLFVVFPHTRPFADSTRLSPAERSDSLYRTPSYLLNSQGPAPRFRLRLHYEATGAGDRTSLSLGAIQVREGSEKLYLGDRELVRGREYQIAYDVGQVTFLRPDSLFPPGAAVQIRAQFEENQRFDDAPKNSLGLAATYTLGPWGRLNAIGLFQREQTPLTRPPLGFEPRSSTVGGVSADLAFRPIGVTRLLDRLPLIETDVPSALTIRGEIAASRPTTNRAGQAYIEEFEGLTARPVTLIQNTFQLGSRPASGRGLGPTYLDGTGGFSPLDAAMMTWQNTIQLGNSALEFEARDIDSTIVLSGVTRQIETVLWFNLRNDTVGGAPDPLTGQPRWIRPHTAGPRWRSITQPLDRTGLGVDLSRTEFLEFWVLEDADRTARGQGAALLFDFGTVFEDAVVVAPDSFQVSGSDTVFTGTRLHGVGRLDSEKDSLTNVFNAAVNDIGIHGDRLDSLVNAGSGAAVTNFVTCDQPTGGFPTFPLGDLAANCTRHNGFGDTEDLDGDNRLDITVGAASEDVLRYVFPIGDDRYFVRAGDTISIQGAGVHTWRLYRIPFRTDSLQVGTPNARQARALRLTLVAPDLGVSERDFSFTLARLRLVGAPWVKRAGTPIAGLSGGDGLPHGEVIASVVSTESRDLGYTPPPGLFNSADRFGADLQFGSQQINEQSLRLLATDLRLDERAEAYVRFVDEADKNFLKYRTLRAWARGRGPGWDTGDLRFYLKAGRDERNFYLYQAGARTDTWEPEIVVSIDRWLTLRAQIEAAWLAGQPPSGAGLCGGDSLAYVACDGPYLVHVRDPGTSPPNLARVSEVAVGMFRVAQNAVIPQAEVWVDDIRLSDAVDDAGVATALDARFTAADVAEASVSVTSRSPQFRQLGEDPTYLGTAAAQVGASFQVGKLVPESWGISAPLSVQHTRTRLDPFYVSRGDVRADALTGHRRPRGESTTWALALRRNRRGTSFLEHVLLDPLALAASSQKASAVAELSDAKTVNRLAAAQYANPPGERSFALTPLSALARALPRFIRDSEFGRSLQRARLRWNPAQVRMGTTFTDNRTDRFAFRAPVLLAGDTAVRPLATLVRTWRNEAGIDLRPFNTLTARADYARVQDLQDYGDSTAVGRLLQDERERFLGTDAGFERNRSLLTAVSVTPVVASWVRPRATFSSSFVFNRDPNARDPVRAGADSAGGFLVPHTLTNSRRRDLGATVDLGTLARRIAGDSSGVTKLFRGILPADLAVTRELRSSFDRAPFFPSMRYQLALGGLDEFRSQSSLPATAAVQTDSRTFAGGIELLSGIRVRGNYQDLATSTWVRRGTTQVEIRQTSREWPSGTLSWLYTPRWALRRLVSSVTVQTRYRRATSSNRQSGAGFAGEGATGETRSTTLNPVVTLSWTGGVLTAGQYAHTLTETVTAGNVTRAERADWGGTFSVAFRVPRSLFRMSTPVRSSVSISASDALVCLVRAGAGNCIPISDSRRRQADVKLDTGFSPTISGGASFGYVLTEQRHLATRLSQYIFTVFAEINFLAGQVR